MRGMLRRRRHPLAVIFLTIFIDLLGIGILIPIMPQLLADPSSPQYLLPAGWTLKQGYMLLGMLVASYPMAQFFATPVLGQLSDQYGRKKILIISFIGTALSYALFAIGIYVRNIPLLFAARIFDGITGGNIAVAQAVIADTTTPENRTKNFGLIGAAFGMGFIIGPYLGGQLADPTIVSWFDAATPFWFAALLSLANIGSIFFFLEETNQHLMKTPLTWDTSIRNIARAFSFPKIRTLFFVNFFYIAGFSFFTSFFGVYLIARFSFSQGNIGNLFAYIGLWVAGTQIVLTRWLGKRVSEQSVLRYALTGSGIALFLLTLPHAWYWLLVLCPFFAMMNGLVQANMTSLISRSADAQIQGEILGINASLTALAQSGPPILAGVVAAATTAQAPILLAGTIMIGSGLLFLTWHSRGRKAA